jgi:hypothetical protein
MGRRFESLIAPQFPAGSGCYIIRHGAHVLYVGQSKELSKRWHTHAHRRFIETNFPDARIEIVPCAVGNLLAMEADLIKRLHPIINEHKEGGACDLLGINPRWWIEALPLARRKIVSKFVGRGSHFR